MASEAVSEVATEAAAVRPASRCPDLLALHRAFPDRYPFLLESVAHGTPQARYDLLFAFPGEALILDAAGLRRGASKPVPGDFLTALDEWWRRERRPVSTHHLPFSGGWFLFLGYELAGQVEPRLRLPAAAGLPTALAVRVPAAVIRDHREGLCWLVAEREALLDRMEVDLAAVPVEVAPVVGPALAGPLEEEASERYLAAVERAKRYIVEGDIFQANLARRWHGRLAAGIDAAELYRRLRLSNPAPFAGLFTWGEGAVVSSSPERLARRHDGWLETRPIAGTRPRGRGADEDGALSRELIGHPKERAEHVMLIDLERNDLGRVCRPGTVAVDELMAVESYAHVHHIVSNVRGRPRPGVTPGAAIRALFPGGTITGCPKVRCMEIIAELEGAGRGPYTGSMGYLDAAGGFDLNILIRSLVVSGDRLHFHAGAGIVADSIPERELEETRAKARGMVLALEGV